MNNISLNSIFNDYFDLAVPDIGFIDILEIAIIAYVTYRFLKWVQTSRAWMLMRGLVVIACFFIAAAILQMNTILWLGEKLISVLFVAIVVVFQPELRNALEHIGSNSILNRFIPSSLRKNRGVGFSDRMINDLVRACFDMGEARTGALIVIERSVDLEEYIRTGIELDSLISRQLIINIFEKNTPLHDGAIIVRDERIVAATCYLPLSQSNSIDKNLGTRHRAALGISEASDSLTIVVSEETGGVSVCENGRIRRRLNSNELKEILLALKNPDEKEKEDAEDEKA